MSFFNFEEIEELNEELNEVEDIKNLSSEDDAKKRFRKYAGLDSYIKITPSDIKENWNNAYMRVCRETGYTKEGLIYILLGE